MAITPYFDSLRWNAPGKTLYRPHYHWPGTSTRAGFSAIGIAVFSLSLPEFTIDAASKNVTLSRFHLLQTILPESIELKVFCETTSGSRILKQLGRQKQRRVRPGRSVQGKEYLGFLKEISNDRSNACPAQGPPELTEIILRRNWFRRN